MKRLGLLLSLVSVVGLTSAAIATDKHSRWKNDLEVEAKLSGFNEVHFVVQSVCLPGATPTPCTDPGEIATAVVSSVTSIGAISTPARGKFEARIDEDAEIIHYELSFEGLRGTVTQAHIHFGQKHTVGGIVVWLCQNIARAPAAVSAATPECLAPGATILNSGRVTGEIRPAQVLPLIGPGPSNQGFAAEDFAELVRAIKAGAAYANVHSTVFGPGEIRGQIHDEDDDKRDKHHHDDHRHSKKSKNGHRR